MENFGKLWKNHRKLGKLWKNYGKTMEKPWMIEVILINLAMFLGL